jgi:hypothetical protein
VGFDWLTKRAFSILFRFQNYILYSSQELWLGTIFPDAFQIKPLHALYILLIAICLIRVKSIHSVTGCFVLIGLGAVAGLIWAHTALLSFNAGEIFSSIAHVVGLIIASGTILFAVLVLRSRWRTFGNLPNSMRHVGTRRFSLQAVSIGFRIRRHDPTIAITEIAFVLCLLGGSLLLLGLVAGIGMACVSGCGGAAGLIDLAIGGIVVLALTASRAHARSGEAAMGQRADDSIAVDPRPPILFLRSFKDEEVTALSEMPGGILWVFRIILLKAPLNAVSDRSRRLGKE